MDMVENGVKPIQNSQTIKILQNIVVVLNGQKWIQK